MKWKEFLLIIIFLFNIVNTQGEHASLHFDFEESNLSNSGFFINAQTPDSIIKIDVIARYNGNQGLLFKSTPTDTNPSSILQEIQTPFIESQFLSYAIFVIDKKPVLRIQLIDADKNIFMIDYMRNSFTTWQSNNDEHYYNVNIDIPKLEWTLIDRNISNDVETAISNSQSPFSAFKPVTISFIQIYQDTAQSGYEEIYNCLDDISLNSDYTTVEQNPNPGVCLDDGTKTSSLTTDDNSTSSADVVTKTVTQSASTTPSIPVSIDFKVPVISLIVSFIIFRRRKAI